jgi:hypothetical protein
LHFITVSQFCSKINLLDLVNLVIAILFQRAIVFTSGSAAASGTRYLLRLLARFLYAIITYSILENSMTIYLKPSQVKTIVESNCKAPVEQANNICIWGSPGIGKSQIVAQVAKSLGFQLEDVRAVTLDPVDLRGLPYVLDGISRWAIPHFLPQSGRWIVFLDEVNRAPQLVQNACLGLIQERRIGEYRVPDEVRFIAACNPNSTGTHRLNDAMTDRWEHLDMQADLQESLDWMLLNGVHDLVRAFLKWQGGVSLSEHDSSARSFPSPRSWVKVSNILFSETDRELRAARYAGSVGEGRGGEFAAFERLTSDLPSMDDILLMPEKAKLPANPSAKYAVSAAIGRIMTAENFGRLMIYMNRMDEKEFSVMAVSDALKRDDDVNNAPEYKSWSEENIKLLL